MPCKATDITASMAWNWVSLLVAFEQTMETQLAGLPSVLSLSLCISDLPASFFSASFACLDETVKAKTCNSNLRPRKFTLCSNWTSNGETSAGRQTQKSWISPKNRLHGLCADVYERAADIKDGNADGMQEEEQGNGALSNGNKGEAGGFFFHVKLQREWCWWDREHA